MMKHNVLFFTLFLSLIGGSVSSLAAQDAAGASDEQLEGLREQTIYIPYEKLRRTFEQEGRGVFLPYEKFQELWQAARDAQPKTAPLEPPVQAIITEISNEAEVRDDALHVRAELQIDLLGKGWIEVPLRLKDAALLSARVGDEPARVVADSEGGHRLLWNRSESESSQIKLQLEYARAITRAPAQNSVEFQAPLAPVNRWRIRIPEAGVKVNVHPLLAATEVPANALADESETDPPDDTAGTVVLAFVGAAPTVRIDWTPRSEGATGLDALVSVQAEQEFVIDQGVTRTRARLLYEISRAELSELKIQVPADQKVVNVADPNLRQWNVESTGDDQTITVGLFQPVRDQQSILIELEKFQPEEQATVSVPTVEAVGVGRQRGVVLVRLADSLRGETIRRTGLSQLDRQEVPEHLRNTPWAHSFHYASLPFDLALQVARVEPRIQVDHLVEAYVDPLGVTLELFAKYDIQRAGVFELLLDLPPGYEVQRVLGCEAAGAQAAVVDTHLVDEANPDRPRLRVNLAAKAQGPTGLRVDLLRRLEDPNLLSPTGQSTSISLVPPRAADPRLARSSGRMVIYAPESLRVSIDQLNGLRNISFEEAFQNTVSLRDGRYAEMKAVQAMFFSDAAASTDLSVQRKQPYVTAQQLLEVRIEPGVTKYVATFYYNILYSGVKSLRIDLPAEMADRVRNQTKSMRESALDEVDGRVGWVFEGESELLGDQQVKLTWESPIDDLGLGQSIDLQVPRLIPREVDRADGQVVLVKSETIDVQPKGTPQGLDPIDPEHDLIGAVRIPDAAAALEYQDDWDLTLTATRYQLQMLKQTSIEQAVLRMVITRSDRIAVQALYRMRSNRQRLHIRLPEEVAPGKIEPDTDPLRINGRRVTLEEGDDSQSFFVPLIGLNADDPFLLELRYTTAGGAERLVYPSFPDEPATQKVNLVAYVPQERTFLGSTGPWTDELRWARRRIDYFGVQQPVPRISVEKLLAQLTQGIAVTGHPAEDFPVDGQPLLFSTLRPPAPDVGALRLHTMSTRWLYALVFGLVSLTGIALVWRPLRERIIVACGFLAALVLLGVFLPTFTRAILNQILLLAVLLVLLLWLVIFLLRSLSRLSEWRPQWPWSRSTQDAASEPVASTLASSDTSGNAVVDEQSDPGPRQEGGTHDES